MASSVIVTVALHALFTYLLHRSGEELPILRRDDGLYRRTKNLHAQGSKLVLKLNADVEGRLPTKRDVYPVRFLVLYDLANKLGRHGQKVHLVGEPFRRCDRRDVRVDENGVDALLERLDRL